MSMVSALFVFHQSYVRDILQQLTDSANQIDVRAIVDSPFSAREHLRNEPVDIVVAGSTFIEDLESLVTSSPWRPRPMSVAVCRAVSAALRERARLSRVDLIIDVSVGLDAARQQLLNEFEGFAKGGEIFGEAKLMGYVDADRIRVQDKIDREITQMVSVGYTDREIAGAVCLSHQTVRNRISRLLGDSGAKNRTHLACMYLTLVHDGVAPFEEIE